MEESAFPVTNRKSLMRPKKCFKKHIQFLIPVFFILVPVSCIYSGAKAEKLPVQSSRFQPGPLSPGDTVTPAQETPASRAEQVMKALSAAYPDRLGPAEFRNGDWAVFLAGKWFYYAEGRLLPEELRSQITEYSGQPFYNYIAELPPWNPPDPEESERMRGMSESRSRQTVRRSQFFYEDLWRIHNGDESWERVKQIRFLGFPVMVHYSILVKLSLVEEKILRESQTSAAVRQWINNINSVDGWSWRNIADTQSRSFHAYGAAIDILPKSTGGLATYWLWTSQYAPEWWAVPYSQRLHPPDEVIKAFESFGFIWGGKWTVYDTMHFEYRPEILIYSGIPMADLRTDLP